MKLKIWAFWGLVAATLAATAAWAFDVPATLPTTDQQGLGALGTGWQFIVEKKYAAALGPILMGLTWALKKYDLVVFNALKLPKVATAIDTFLDKPFVSFLLPITISAIGGFVTALATGHSVTDALGAIWASSSTAISAYVGLKKIGEQLDAGKAEAATVTDKASAVEELKKP